MVTRGNTTQREDDATLERPRFSTWLRWVHLGCDRPIRIEHGLVIGREVEGGVSIGGRGVSRQHVQIHRQGPLFALKDLGSTNGTFLNGKRVQHAALAPGDVLRIGDCLGVFSSSVDEPSDFSPIARGLLGGHELRTVLTSAILAAASDLPIVLTGATGTGKERVARALHDFSGRRGAFHAVNCAALPQELAEAELFGHRKGAFTGAERSTLGHFRAADQGTLFLDEIAELPLGMQAKLLRVLEERSVRPLGDTESVPINVRVIAATQRPLSESIERKLFRDDLSARLAGLTLELPSLSDRRADVAPLFRAFLQQHSGGRPPEVETKLAEGLTLLGWPGNVREVEQLARRMLAVHGAEPKLTREMLPESLSDRLPTNGASIPPSDSMPVDRRDYDLQRLAHGLKKTGGSVTAAAALLGFSRQRAYRLLEGQSATEFVNRYAELPPLDERSSS